MIDPRAPDFAAPPAGHRSRQPTRQLAEPGTQAPMVSIVTPYYDTGALFLETVASVQAQTLQNWEWLVVDDGSRDAQAVAVLAKVAQDDPRIRVLRQDNAGPAAARNTGAAQASAPYLCLLDSDDLIEPTFLEKCVCFLQAEPAFAFCNAYSVLFGAECRLHPAGYEAGVLHIDANVAPPIALVRRAAYLSSGGFDASIRQGHEDWDFWLNMARHGHWGYTLAEYLQWYRKRSDGRFEELLRAGDAHARFEQTMRSKYADLRERFPAPQRGLAQPYATIDAHMGVDNQLRASASGLDMLFLLPWMSLGGADRVNLDLIEGLVERGVGVSVCTTLASDHAWQYKFTELTPDVFALASFLREPDYPRFLTYLIRSRKIGLVVISGSTLGYELLPYLRVHCPGTAFIDLSHVEEDWFNGGHPRFGVGYQDLLDRNLVTTRHLADWMAARGARRDRIDVMYTGVRVPPADPAAAHWRAQLGIPATSVVIVFAGRFCAQKRPDLLVAILLELARRGLDFRAVLIGDGELRPQVEQGARSLGAQVRLLGYQSHSQWLQALRGADILLMPSAYEGISIALLEALACGVVPVASQVGGQDEVITPERGVLLPLQSRDAEIAAYADAIAQLIEEPKRRQSMSEAGRQFAETQLRWDAMIDRFVALTGSARASASQYDGRFALTASLAGEWAVQTLELARLRSAVTRAADVNQQAADMGGLLTSPGETAALSRVVARLARSALFVRLLRNRVIRRVGAALYRNLIH